MSEQNKASPAALTESNAAAAAAIQFALKADEGMVWLQCWNEGDFKACREEWPEAPDECYIGADPMLADPSADRQVVALSVQCKTCGGTGDVIDMNGVWCGYCWCGARSKTKQASPAALTDELVALLKEIRPNYGDVGTRDVDVAAQQKRIDRAIALLATQPAAPAALTDAQRRAAAKAMVEVFLGFPAPDREPGDLDLRAVDAVVSTLAAQAAAPVQPDECAQDVYQHGVSIGLFDIPKATANAICAGITAVTGARVDWHYIAGRVHMKAIAAPAHPDRQGVALSEEVWGVRIGDSDRWAYTNSESDADFWGKQSGLKYEKHRYVRASDRQSMAPSNKDMREAFEEALPFIGGTIHVFSPTRTARDERYLEGITEVCWRTWQAAFSRASSSRAEVESAAVPTIPPIKGAWIDGGYVIVVPAGIGNAEAVKSAILAAAEAPNGEGK